MANSFLSVKEIARQVLPRLIENLVFPNLCYKDYSNDFVAGKGATVIAQKPYTFTANDFADGDDVSAQDIDQKGVEVVLDKLATVDVEWGSIEAAVNMTPEKQGMIVEGMAAALAQKINGDGLALYKDIPYRVGTAGTTPDALDDFSEAAKMLNLNKAPISLRRAVWDPSADSKFKLIPAIVNANKSGSTEALRAGSIGDIFGLSNYMSQAVKAHTTGAAGTPLIDGAASAGVTQIHVDGLTAAFVAGDLFTVAGDTTQYVVTKAGVLSTADQDIDIYPALAKNAADNAALTVVNSHTANLVFHQNAFAYVTRPLVTPTDKEAWTTSYGGITIRAVKGYDMKKKKTMLSLDTAYGYKTLCPELAVRVLG